MPKRVLFIISNMETGGVSKAMTSLLASHSRDTGVADSVATWDTNATYTR